MIEHEISLLQNTEPAIRAITETIEAQNAQMGQRRFNCSVISWADARTQLMRAALYKKGPVASEIGATFTGDFVHMNSLRPYTAAEIQRAGGPEAFFPLVWRGGMVPNSSEVFSLPLRVDVRMVWYWRDMLEQAGVDEAGAFSSPEAFHETMRRLKAAGTEYPLLTFTSNGRNIVYNLASWLWARGGEFIDSTGKVAFHQPQALQGISDYFRLHPFIDPSRPGYNPTFAARKAAVIIENPGMLDSLHAGGFITPAMDSRVGVAAMPGPAFVGGTNLVIWQHAPYEAAQAAAGWITGFLESAAYLDFARSSQYLPVRRAAASDPRWADPRHQAMFRMLETGRSHYGSYLWLVLADRMSATAEGIFDQLFASPDISDADAAALVRQKIENLASRLEATIH